jgi:hypothetical protein
MKLLADDCQGFVKGLSFGCQEAAASGIFCRITLEAATLASELFKIIQAGGEKEADLLSAGSRISSLSRRQCQRLWRGNCN